MIAEPAILGGRPVRPELPLWPVLTPSVAAVFEQLMADGTWGTYHAAHTEQLIAALKETLNVEYVFLTCSGTAAVELALRGCRVQSGGEVVLSAYDYKPNFTNITYLDATPVLVDVREVDSQLDVTQLEEAVTDQTQAILASHLHGGLVDMAAVMEIAQRHNVLVIEDSCQMPGARCQGKTTGCHGDVGVISFGGTKTITAGRGGAVFTNRDDIAQRIRLAALRGNEAYPLSQMQAAIVLPQLQDLPARQQLRTERVNQLLDLLNASLGLTPFHIPSDPAFAPDFYKLGFWYDPDRYDGLPRECFIKAVRAEGIPLDIGFRALHRIHAKRRFRTVGDLPQATRTDDSIVALHHPLLYDENGPQQFVESLNVVQTHASQIRDAHSVTGNHPDPL